MAVTILSMLQKVAALSGRDALSGSTDPPESVAVQFFNEAILLTVGLLCPVRIGNNILSAGALDKLKLITATDEVTDSTNVTVEPNEIPFPDSGDAPICYINDIQIKVDSGAYYMAMEVDVGSLYVHMTGRNYAVTATNPLFAYANGAIWVVPGATTTEKATYHYVKKPATVTSGSNYPIDEDLVPINMDYVYGFSNSRGSQPGQSEQADYFLGRFAEGIMRVLGVSKELPEKEVDNAKR